MSLTTADNSITATRRSDHEGQRAPKQTQGMLRGTKWIAIREVWKVRQTLCPFLLIYSHSLSITLFRSGLKLPALIRRPPYHLLCCAAAVQILQKTLSIKLSASTYIRCHYTETGAEANTDWARWFRTVNIHHVWSMPLSKNGKLTAINKNNLYWRALGTLLHEQVIVHIWHLDFKKNDMQVSQIKTLSGRLYSYYFHFETDKKDKHFLHEYY